MAISRSGMNKELFGGKKAAKGAPKKSDKPDGKKLPPWLKPKGGKNAK